MPLSGFTAAAARVVLGVESEQFHTGIRSAEADFSAATAAMRGQASELAERQLKASIAAERYNTALKQLGPASIETRAALAGLVGEQRRLIEVQNMGTASLSRFERGLVAGAAHGRIFGRSMAFASNAFLGGAGFVYALHSAIEASSKFQSEMRLVHTQALAPMSEVIQKSKEMLAIAPKLGMGPEELAKGLYRVESSGYRATKALNILTTATKGAKVGGADLQSTTNALIAAMKSQLKGTETLQSSMGILDAIVGRGNMRMEELAGSMSTGILAQAKAFNVGMADIGAAIDVLTVRGVPAEVASTRLRFSLSLLASQTPKAEKELKKIGITTDELGQTMRTRGLVPALELLDQKLKTSGLSAQKQADVITRAFGGGRSSSTIITMLKYLDNMRENLRVIEGASHSFGSRYSAWSKTTAAAFDRLSASAETMKIKLGDALAPSAADVANAVTKWVSAEKNQQRIVNDLVGGFKMAKEGAHVFGEGLKQVAAVVHVFDEALGGSGHTLKLFIEILALRKLLGFAAAFNKNVLNPVRNFAQEAQAASRAAGQFADAQERLANRTFTPTSRYFGPGAAAVVPWRANEAASVDALKQKVDELAKAEESAAAVVAKRGRQFALAVEATERASGRASKAAGSAAGSEVGSANDATAAQKRLAQQKLETAGIQEPPSVVTALVREADAATGTAAAYDRLAIAKQQAAAYMPQAELFAMRSPSFNLWGPRGGGIPTYGSLGSALGLTGVAGTEITGLVGKQLLEKGLIEQNPDFATPAQRAQFRRTVERYAQLTGMSGPAAQREIERLWQNAKVPKNVPGHAGGGREGRAARAPRLLPTAAGAIGRFRPVGGAETLGFNEEVTPEYLATSQYAAARTRKLLGPNPSPLAPPVGMYGAPSPRGEGAIHDVAVRVRDASGNVSTVRVQQQAASQRIAQQLAEDRILAEARDAGSPVQVLTKRTGSGTWLGAYARGARPKVNAGPNPKMTGAKPSTQFAEGGAWATWLGQTPAFVEAKKRKLTPAQEEARQKALEQRAQRIVDERMANPYTAPGTTMPSGRISKGSPDWFETEAARAQWKESLLANESRNITVPSYAPTAAIIETARAHVLGGGGSTVKELMGSLGLSESEAQMARNVLRSEGVLTTRTTYRPAPAAAARPSIEGMNVKRIARGLSLSGGASQKLKYPEASAYLAAKAAENQTLTAPQLASAMGVKLPVAEQMLAEYKKATGSRYAAAQKVMRKGLRQISTTGSASIPALARGIGVSENVARMLVEEYAQIGAVTPREEVIRNPNYVPGQGVLERAPRGTPQLVELLPADRRLSTTAIRKAAYTATSNRYWVARTDRQWRAQVRNELKARGIPRSQWPAEFRQTRQAAGPMVAPMQTSSYFERPVPLEESGRFFPVQLSEEAASGYPPRGSRFRRVTEAAMAEVRGGGAPQAQALESEAAAAEKDLRVQKMLAEQRDKGRRVSEAETKATGANVQVLGQQEKAARFVVASNGEITDGLKQQAQAAEELAASNGKAAASNGKVVDNGKKIARLTEEQAAKQAALAEAQAGLTSTTEQRVAAERALADAQAGSSARQQRLVSTLREEYTQAELTKRATYDMDAAYKARADGVDALTQAEARQLKIERELSGSYLGGTRGLYSGGGPVPMALPARRGALKPYEAPNLIGVGKTPTGYVQNDLAYGIPGGEATAAFYETHGDPTQWRYQNGVLISKLTGQPVPLDEIRRGTGETQIVSRSAAQRLRGRLGGRAAALRTFYSPQGFVAQNAMGYGIAAMMFADQAKRLPGMGGSAGEGFSKMIMGAGTGMMLAPMLGMKNPWLAAGIGASFGLKSAIGGAPGSTRAKVGGVVGGMAEGAAIGALAGPYGAAAGAAAGLAISLFKLGKAADKTGEALKDAASRRTKAQADIATATRGVAEGRTAVVYDQLAIANAKATVEQAKANEKATRGTKQHAIAVLQLKAAQEGLKEATRKLRDDEKGLEQQQGKLRAATRHDKEALDDMVGSLNKAGKEAVDSTARWVGSFHGAAMKSSTTFFKTNKKGWLDLSSGGQQAKDALAAYTSKLQGYAKEAKKNGNPQLAAAAQHLIDIANATKNIPTDPLLVKVLLVTGVDPTSYANTKAMLDELMNRGGFGPMGAPASPGGLPGSIWKAHKGKVAYDPTRGWVDEQGNVLPNQTAAWAAWQGSKAANPQQAVWSAAVGAWVYGRNAGANYGKPVPNQSAAQQAWQAKHGSTRPPNQAVVQMPTRQATTPPTGTEVKNPGEFTTTVPGGGKEKPKKETFNETPPGVDHIVYLKNQAVYKGDTGTQLKMIAAEEKVWQHQLSLATNDAQRSIALGHLQDLKNERTSLDIQSVRNKGMGLIPANLQNALEDAKTSGSEKKIRAAYVAEENWLDNYLKRPGLSARQIKAAKHQRAVVAQAIARIDKKVAGTAAGIEKLLPHSILSRVETAQQDVLAGGGSLEALTKERDTTKKWLAAGGHSKADVAAARKRLTEVERRIKTVGKKGSLIPAVIAAYTAEINWVEKHIVENPKLKWEQHRAGQKLVTQLMGKRASWQKKLTGGTTGTGNAAFVSLLSASEQKTWFGLENAVYRAKQTTNTNQDDIKALRAEDKFVHRIRDAIKDPKLQLVANKLLASIDTRLAQLVKANADLLRQAEQQFLEERRSFWDAYGSNIWEGGRASRSSGGGGGLSSSAGTVVVNQHFKGGPTRDYNREARFASLAARHLLD